MFAEELAVSNERTRVPTNVYESRQPTETKLVETAKAGQSTAFGALCERYTQKLQRIALRVTRNPEDAEDAVQDALLRAFIHLRDFDGRSSFATWLTRIAINSALMILRKKRNSLEVVVNGTDDSCEGGRIFEIADQAPNPEVHCARREEEGILKRAVQNLRPTLREVVEIQQLRECSIGEAADAMRISVAAAKGRLFHARAELRRSAVVKLMRKRRSCREFRVLSAA